jgi:hypothetical protein
LTLENSPSKVAASEKPLSHFTSANAVVSQTPAIAAHNCPSASAPRPAWWADMLSFTCASSAS